MRPTQIYFELFKCLKHNWADEKKIFKLTYAYFSISLLMTEPAFLVGPYAATLIAANTMTRLVP
jgi:hypothetical protein